MHRESEAACARIMAMCGSSEPLIELEGEELALLWNTRQWRKPLSIAEVAQMAPTPEVLARPGRP